MPNRPSPKLKELARQIVAIEAALGNPAGAKDCEAFCTSKKLCDKLGKLIGLGGCSSLVSRALALSGDEVPSLRAFHVRKDGSIDVGEAGVDLREAARGEVVLMAHAVSLLVTLVGSALTFEVLRGIWPSVTNPG